MVHQHELFQVVPVLAAVDVVGAADERHPVLLREPPLQVRVIDTHGLHALLQEPLAGVQGQAAGPQKLVHGLAPGLRPEADDDDVSPPDLHSLVGGARLQESPAHGFRPVLVARVDQHGLPDQLVQR